MIKLKIDSNLCLGCGACVAIAPETFLLDPETGKAKIANQPKEIDETIQAAMDSCPVKAIKKEEEK